MEYLIRELAHDELEIAHGRQVDIKRDPIGLAQHQAWGGAA